MPLFNISENEQRALAPVVAWSLKNKKHQLEVLQLGAVLQHLRRTMHGAHGKLSVTEKNGVWEVLNELSNVTRSHLGALAVCWVWRIICPWCGSSKVMVCTHSQLSLDVHSCNWLVALRACRDYP